MAIVVAFLIPFAVGAVLAAILYGKWATAQLAVKDKDAELAALKVRLDNTVAALDHTNAELAQAKADWQADATSRAAVAAQRDARIADLEAELARNLDPRAVGDRARRMLSGEGSAPGPASAAPAAGVPGRAPAR